MCSEIDGEGEAGPDVVAEVFFLEEKNEGIGKAGHTTDSQKKGSHTDYFPLGVPQFAFPKPGRTWCAFAKGLLQGLGERVAKTSEW